jgi:hypothetical protein
MGSFSFKQQAGHKKTLSDWYADYPVERESRQVQLS